MGIDAAEAYRFYKSLHPNATIVFHLEGRYVAIFNDVHNLDQIGNEVSFSDDDIGKLASIGNGGELCIVEYRNESGRLDYPDINKLKKERCEDY